MSAEHAKISRKVVARAAKEVIADYLHAFETVEFAVYCPPQNDMNFKVFFKRVSGRPGEVEGKSNMPFRKTNVSEQIEMLRKTDTDFKKAWDESRTEYQKIGEMISLRKKEKFETEK
ncbi:MAG: hypothetical protein ACLUD2_15460 [Clostridium sp.]